jgi:hypothetical protein
LPGGSFTRVMLKGPIKGAFFLHRRGEVGG